ncbi:glycosyltransferase family 4 protein [Planctomycetota bacterium]
MLNIGKLLQREGIVHLVCIRGGMPTQEEYEATKAVFGDFDCFVTENYGSRKIVSKVRRYVDLRWVQGRAKSISDRSQEQISKLSEDYDIVWIHTLAIADMLGRYSWQGHSVLDVDDLCSHIHKQEIWTERGIRNKSRAMWRMLMQARWENDILNRFEAVCVCSDRDRITFKSDDRVFVLSNGFKAPSEEPVRHLNGFARIGFIGTLWYPPNVEGLNWFIEEILPQVINKNPAVRLRVVGKLRDSVKFVRHPNVDYLDFIDDPTDEMATWSLSVVPLRIGGGTRIKILDSFSKMCPVVSTSLGAYGLNVNNGRHLLVADKAGDFAGACIKLFEQPKFASGLAKEGLTLLKEKYTWDSFRPVVKNVIEKCMSG